MTTGFKRFNHLTLPVPSTPVPLTHVYRIGRSFQPHKYKYIYKRWTSVSAAGGKLKPVTVVVRGGPGEDSGLVRTRSAHRKPDTVAVGHLYFPG